MDIKIIHAYLTIGHVKVMIIDGSQVETVAIGSKNQSDTGCPAIPNIPYEASGMVVGSISGGNPTICGSWVSRLCYQFNTTSRKWSRHGDFVLPEYFAGSVTFNENEWWLLGQGGSGLDSSTWIIRDGSLSRGPEMPIPASFLCAAMINETHAFVSGGLTGLNANRVFLSDTFIMNWTSKAWTRMPDMPELLGFHRVR